MTDDDVSGSICEWWKITLIILQLPIKRRLFLKRLDLTSVTNNLFHVRLFRTENLVAMKRDLTLLYSIRIDKVKTIARSRDVAVELKNILRNRYSTEK